MKKMFLFSAIIIAIVFMLSCEKTKNIVSEPIDEWNRAELINNGLRTGTLYNVSFQCGHSGATCPGCITQNGHTIHIDCQGNGTLCNRSGVINVQLVSANLYTATTQDSTDLTSDPYFNMPARSLYAGMDDTGLPRWLNIPAQFVLRDSATHLFTFNGVFFSQQQVYKNQ